MLGIVTRKNLTESQLLRHCRRGRRRAQGGKKGGENNKSHRSSSSSQLLGQSLSASQQLSPLRLPCSSPWTTRSMPTEAPLHAHSVHPTSGTSTSGINTSGEGSLLLMDRSTSSSVSNVTSSSAGEERDLLSDGSQKGSKLLNFFFPGNSNSNSNRSIERARSGGDEDLSSQELQMHNGSWS